MKKRVLILCGGRSDEHEISLISAQGILEALDRSLFTPTLVGISRKGVWYLEQEKNYFEGGFKADSIRLNTHAPTLQILPYSTDGSGTLVGEFGKFQFDVVFPILHGPFGEDGTIQGLFDIMGVPYVGSGCQSSAVCMDKELTKVLTRSHQIPGTDFVTVTDAKLAVSAQTLGFPVFVKPARLGSSVGISKVTRQEDLSPAIAKALKFDSKCLIEKAVEGREIECAVLGHTHSAIASVPGEIIPSPKVGWYSYEAKYLSDDGAITKVPADLGAGWVKKIQAFAIRVFEVLECEGMARVDLFFNEKKGEIILNEVNTIPGFTPISMYPKMWMASGISYPELISRLIDLALEKKRT